MKKILLILTVFALTISSCSSDENDNQDALIGNWKIQQRFINNVEQSLDDCEKENTLSIKSNGTYTALGYDEVNGNCVLESTSNGNWENKGASSYRLTSGAQINDVEITFNGATLTLSYTQDSDNLKDVLIKN